VLSPARLSLFAVSVSLALAACQATNVPSVPARTAAAVSESGAAQPSEAPPSVGASSPAQAGQTDTDWGRIWDSLPADFPSYPGSTPAQEAAAGPASGVLAVQGTDAGTIVAWLQSMLEQRSYRTETLSGPLEDGSFVLDLVGATPGCRVQVSVAPLGGLTTVTVLYGASCPGP
jgi:hypothetical protein